MKQLINPKRNPIIDHLRGYAMFIMLLTHTLSYYLKDSSIFHAWDLIHFAVPIFLFCSSWLFFEKEIDKPLHIVPYLVKRVVRLLKPYYLFFLSLILVLLVVKPQNINIPFLVQSISLTGGIDINWLVLLFLELIPVFLLLRLLLHKNIKLFYLFGLISFLSTILLLFYKPALPAGGPSAISYKLYMWLPWSTVIFFTYFFRKIQQAEPWKKYVFFLLPLSLLAISYLLLANLEKTLSFFQNKYPPNIYYLSYGLTLIPLWLWIAKTITTKISIIDRFLSFLSTYSYEIYFIHYLVLMILTYLKLQTYLPWPVFFLILILVTGAIQKGLLHSVYRTKKS